MRRGRRSERHLCVCGQKRRLGSSNRLSYSHLILRLIQLHNNRIIKAHWFGFRGQQHHWIFAIPWEYTFIKHSSITYQLLPCLQVKEHPSLVLSRVANKDTLLCVRLQSTSLVLLHIHIRHAAKDAQIRHIGLKPINAFTRRHGG